VVRVSGADPDDQQASHGSSLRTSGAARRRAPSSR
jgi:hypothetical protein